MADTMPDPLAPRHPERSEPLAKVTLLKAERMAKASLRKSERRLIGQAIDRTRQLARLSLKEFADAVQRDERQVARWIDGSEPAQLGAVLAIQRFRPLLVIAFSEIAGQGVEVATHIIVKSA